MKVLSHNFDMLLKVLLVVEGNKGARVEGLVEALKERC